MIHFVVALTAEAGPLIEHYRLEPTFQTGPFKVYENETKRLVISGVGKERSSNATAFLHAFSGAVSNQAWINFGIAGHSSYPIGTGILASRISDLSSGLSVCLSDSNDGVCQAAPVLTVSRAETKYSGDWVYEMEASGFYHTASLFSDRSLIRCYKIISDNRTEPASRVSEAFVRSLVKRHLKALDRLMGTVP